MDSILSRCLRSNRVALLHAALLMTLFILPTRAQSSGLQFVPITPCRVVDTRNPTGDFGGPALEARSIRTFNIPKGPCKGIPSTAAAYSLTVSVVPPGLFWYLTLFPAGEVKPFVSTLNSYDGRIKAVAAITAAGTDGGVSVYVTHATQLLLDINGYFVAPTSDMPAPGLQFFPVTPCRLVDTRSGTALAAGETRDFPVQGSCGVPDTAQAYSLNVTAVPQGALSFLTAFASGTAKPNVTTLNAGTGDVTADAAIVAAGSGGFGNISIFVLDVPTDVLIDVNGYFAPPPASPATPGLSFYPVTECRVLDTRAMGGAFRGTVTEPVQGGICGAPAAQAYVLNATVVPREDLGNLSLVPTGTPTPPSTSTLNSTTAVTSNMAIVSTTNGSIDAYSFGLTYLILDLSGYFAP